MDASVQAVFDSYPELYRKPLLELRQMVYTVATGLPEVGEITESLKWGQPTYTTLQTKAGTPIRLDRFGEDKIALFFHCQTTLVESFRRLFGETLAFSKNRAIILDPCAPLPKNELALCIEMALTYHLQKAC